MQHWKCKIPEHDSEIDEPTRSFSKSFHFLNAEDAFLKCFNILVFRMFKSVALICEYFTDSQF